MKKIKNLFKKEKVEEVKPVEEVKEEEIVNYEPVIIDESETLDESLLEKIIEPTIVAKDEPLDRRGNPKKKVHARGRFQ